MKRVQLGHAVVADLLQNFVIPIEIAEDKLVAAIEFHPGNKRVVHHAVLFLDDKGQARKLDAATPEPGYGNFGGPGFLPSGALGGWSVGNTARRLPNEMGRYLKKGSDLVVQVHYHPTGKVEVDQSEIGIYFVKKPVAESLQQPAKLVGSIWCHRGVVRVVGSFDDEVWIDSVRSADVADDVGDLGLGDSVDGLVGVSPSDVGTDDVGDRVVLLLAQIGWRHRCNELGLELALVADGGRDILGDGQTLNGRDAYINRVRECGDCRAAGRLDRLSRPESRWHRDRRSHRQRSVGMENSPAPFPKAV